MDTLAWEYLALTPWPELTSLRCIRLPVPGPPGDLRPARKVLSSLPLSCPAFLHYTELRGHRKLTALGRSLGDWDKSLPPSFSPQFLTDWAPEVPPVHLLFI